MGLNVAAETGSKRTLDPDLAARLASFRASRSFRTSVRSSFASYYRDNDSDRDSDFVAHAKTHPETWMFHQSLCLPNRHPQTAVQFAHQLLHDAPEMYRVQEPSTRDIDTQVYECIGLAGASDGFSALRLATVPAMVDYTIHEYDGLESVSF